MWIAIGIILAFGVGIGCGFGIEKLGQFMYFKRLAQQDNGKVGNEREVKLEALSALVNKEVETIFIGDSITELYPIDEFYFTKNYLNRGVGGSTSAGVLRRLDKQVINLNPKRIIMLIGTNDIGLRVSEATMLENIEKIIKRIREKLIKTELIVEGIYPINKKKRGVGARTPEAIDQANDKIKEICKKYDVQFVDALPVLADKDGALDMKFTGDGLHLNVVGYTKLTEFLKENIKGL